MPDEAKPEAAEPQADELDWSVNDALVFLRGCRFAETDSKILGQLERKWADCDLEMQCRRTIGKEVTKSIVGRISRHILAFEMVGDMAQVVPVHVAWDGPPEQYDYRFRSRDIRSLRSAPSEASSEAPPANRLPDQQPGKTKPTLAWRTAKEVERLLDEKVTWTEGRERLLVDVQKRMGRKFSMRTLETALTILRQFGIKL
jgi:hypothetical protein